MENEQIQTMEVAKKLAHFQETIQVLCQTDMGGFGFVNSDEEILMSGPAGRKTNHYLGLELPKGIGLGWLVVEKASPWQLKDYLASDPLQKG